MSIEATDRPNTVEISEDETTVTVVASVGAIGPQGPEGPQGPPGEGTITAVTATAPLASSGGNTPDISFTGTLGVGYGGTGVTSLTGYVYGNGGSPFTASTTIPNSAVSGLGTMALQNATSIAVTGGYLADVSEEVNCVNRTGSNIPIGKAVYIIGAHGDVPEIALADASGESTAARTLGITAEAIADAGTGRVCFSGLLKGVNTNALTEGALVWLSETAGELTTTRPTQPAHGVFLGLCVKQAPGGAGILFVSVVNGQELDELHDVLITSPTAGQLFKRNTGNTLWVNASPASLTASNDTNVTLTLGGNAATALVNDASLALGWTGTLASSRLNANVVQAVTSDANVTGSINSQALTLGWTGQLPVSRGGSGASSLSGYLVGNGGSAFTAVSSIPGSAISGNIAGNAANVTGTVAVGNGGTGATSLTGYLVGNGGSAFTAVSSIPNTAISGLGTMSTQDASNVAITGGTATSLALVTVAAGTVGSPSIAAQNDTNTGWYWPAADTLAAATGGIERLRVNNAGRTIFNATSTQQYPVFVSQATSGSAALLYFSNASGEFYIGNEQFSGLAAGSGVSYSRTIWGQGAYPMTFGTNNVERLRLTSGGDVAIAATAKLYLDGTAATGNTYLQEVSADTLVAVTNGTERLRIGSTGNVSIGVNSPAALLEMAGDSVTEFRQTRYTTGAAGPVNTLRKARGTQNSPTAVAAGDSLGILSFIGYGGTNFSTLATVQGVITDYTSDTNMTAHLRFLTAAASTTAVEQMRITGTGVVAVGAGWGTTSPAGNVLQGPNGSGTNVPGGNLTIGGGNGTGTGGSGAILFQTAPAGSSGTTANTMAERMRIDNVGNVGVGTSTFGSSAANVFAVATGTEPTSGPADTVQIFSVDRSAGNTIPGIRCEGTGVTDAGITSTAVTHKIAMKVNGTVYYLLATTNAT